MELSQQVCSLEYAMRLKELGVKQDSLFYWEYNNINYRYFRNCMSMDNSEVYKQDGFSAFTVAELGDILPKNNNDIYNTTSNLSGGWICTINNIYCFSANTEADARAKMLIYLLENKLIKLEA